MSGDHAGARRLVRDALPKAADDTARARLLTVLGRTDLDAGEAASAAKTLEEAAKLATGSALLQAEIELDLGRARRRGGDLEGALRALAHASERFRAASRPEGERRALAQRGKVLYAKGDLKGSRAAFRAALDIEGPEPEAWRLQHALARAYEKDGRKGEADRCYRAAREAGWDGRSKDADFGGTSPQLSDLAALAEAARGGDASVASTRSPRERVSGENHEEAVKALEAARQNPSASASRKGASSTVAALDSPVSDPGPAHADEDTDALARAVEGLPREDLVRLVSLSGALASSISPQALLDLILDRAIAWTGAARGYVVLCSETDPGRMEVHAARAAGSAAVAEPEDEVSRNLVREVVAKGVPVVSDDAAKDVRLTGFTSVMEKALRSVACYPLRLHRATLGAFYLERRDRSASFGNRERALLQALAALQAIALDRSLKSVKLEENYKETKRALDERTGHAFGIVGRARAMRNVFRLIEKVRDHDANVLIEGATGTGKELVARAIHKSSKRHEGPFVVESAGSMPDTLLEAELFGHEKGAFTGATEARRGAFERANGGTIFLDEVSDMPARMQALLLRVLETSEVRPLGAPAARKVDCRIIAASRHDLRTLVQKGEFREDLYFRLNVIKIHVPSLRDRKEDIPALSEAFLREIGRPASALSPRALEWLLAHDWPGNVRELKHAIERAHLLAGDGGIDARHLGLDGEGPNGGTLGAEGPGGVGLPPAPAAGGPAGSAGKVSFRGHVLNRRQLALIDYLRANGLATNREYVELVKVSIPTGWRDLKDLLDKGVIRAEGQGRNTVYRLEAGVKDELGTSTTDGT